MHRKTHIHRPLWTHNEEAALEAVDAEGLRQVIRDVLPSLDQMTRTHLLSALAEHATRSSSGWTPESPSDEAIQEIESFAATNHGYVEPSRIDEYLAHGANAFLAKNYRAAMRVFYALLVPLGRGEICVGQHEMVSEVLGVDVSRCAVQYAVSAYMTSDPGDRAEAVMEAIGEFAELASFLHPLHELERIAIEPLPEFDGFLAEWKTLVEGRIDERQRTGSIFDEAHWLREVVQRTQGCAGLGEVARASGRPDDLLAWCGALAREGDWSGALAACDEATDLVAEDSSALKSLLDAAALAAQQLEREDLPALLERAWRQGPDMVRLCRWLGSSRTKKELRGRVHDTLVDPPTSSPRQLGLLHFLHGDLASASELLASAPGLGWSRDDHPGHVLFALFLKLFRDVEFDALWTMDDCVTVWEATGDEPRLATPGVSDIVKLATPPTLDVGTERTAVLRSMRTAASKRVAGVTERQRRRHYGHAASLATACARVDGSPAGAKWLAELRQEYSRYPALQREFDLAEES